MTKTDLTSFASSLPAAWRSTVIGRPGGANFKVVRMDRSGYPEEVHSFDEALLVLDGQLNLCIDGNDVSVAAGQVYIVPAGRPHAVAPGSSGTLIIIDAIQQ